jgi:hypothetical protein
MKKYIITDIHLNDDFYQDKDSLIGEAFVGDIEQTDKDGFVTGTFQNIEVIPEITDFPLEEFFFYKIKVKEIL